MKLTSTQAKRLGKLISGTRTFRDMSIRDLEHATGIPRTVITKIEHGDFVTPPKQLHRLVDVLGIDHQRVEAMTGEPMAMSLPGVRIYFRAKYGLTDDEVAAVEAYIDEIRGNHA